MSPGDDTRDAGNGLLGAVLAPLRLPERALKALESFAGAAQHIGPIHREIVRVREQVDLVPGMLATVERISRQAEPLDEMLPALEQLEQTMSARLEALHAVIVALESDESHLNMAVEGLCKQVDEMHDTIRGLRDDVQRVTDRMPDPDRGPLEKAKEVLTGTGG